MITKRQFFEDLDFKELDDLYQKIVPKVAGVYLGSLPFASDKHSWNTIGILAEVLETIDEKNVRLIMLNGQEEHSCEYANPEYFYVIPKPIATILLDIDSEEAWDILESCCNLTELLNYLENDGYCIDTNDFLEECLVELRKHGFTFFGESKATTPKLNFMEELQQEEENSLTQKLTEPNATPKKSEIEKSHTTTQITPKKENNSMFKSMNFLKGFDTIDTSKVKMTMFGIGVENVQGIVQTYNALTHELTDVTDFVMDGFGGMDNMVFVFPAQKVKKGDLVVFNKSFCFVTGIQGKRITAVDFNTNQEVTIVKQKHAMGFNFVPKVMCPFGNMFTATEKDPIGGFESMLPMMMMMNMSKGDSDTKGGMGNMMEMMMMSQLFGGNGENPFAKMFGGISADEEEETEE